MATILNLTSFDAALKVKYPSMAIKNMVYKNNPFLALVAKSENQRGKHVIVPVHYGVPMGRSATFTTAGSNKYSSAVTAFEMVRVSNYGRADIDNQTLEAAMGDGNAFMEAAAFEIDGVLHSLGRDLAHDLFSDGFGWRGRIGSKSGALITLSNISDIVNFEVGMVLNCTTTRNSTAHSGNLTVTAVDRDAGTVNLKTSSGGASWVSPRYLHVQGDAAVASTKRKLQGLAAWLPSTAPSSGEAFNGVDRSKDPTRLAGLRVDGTGQTAVEALIKAGAALWREGGRASHFFCNPSHEADICKALQGQVVYDTVKASDAEVSFDAIKVRTPGGAVKVVSDPNCPTGVGYLVDLATWKLGSIGGAPKILMTDGIRVLRNSATDSVEVRCGYYATFYCTNPGFNARVSLDT